jgi:hypothetical protein
MNKSAEDLKLCCVARGLLPKDEVVRDIADKFESNDFDTLTDGQRRLLEDRTSKQIRTEEAIAKSAHLKEQYQFVDSLHCFFDARGFLTPKQLAALERLLEGEKKKEE